MRICGDNNPLTQDVNDDVQILGMNLSQKREHFSREAVHFQHPKRWAKQHAEYIVAYNQITVLEGLPLEQWRQF